MLVQVMGELILQDLEVFDPSIEGLMPVMERLPEPDMIGCFHVTDPLGRDDGGRVF